MAERRLNGLLDQRPRAQIDEHAKLLARATVGPAPTESRASPAADPAGVRDVRYGWTVPRTTEAAGDVRVCSERR